jgi:hypothetical protein
MRKRPVNDLKNWELELYEAARTNLEFHQSMLDFIATGEPVIHADLGDISEDEFPKSTWWVATYKAQIVKFEYDLANDNEVFADEELSDLISGDW